MYNSGAIWRIRVIISNDARQYELLPSSISAEQSGPVFLAHLVCSQRKKSWFSLTILRCLAYKQTYTQFCKRRWMLPEVKWWKTVTCRGSDIKPCLCHAMILTTDRVTNWTLSLGQHSVEVGGWTAESLELGRCCFLLLISRSNTIQRQQQV